ncbi:hypothetical protein NP590_00885 [Methylomonas sp. SURF-2]|uniref:Uncharacterized protein n=1 Tax=Methylomonas subterranea TaxID=2952225 RepID=A0ABT1TAZ4_9GAMM|nr:hypothetical protein [Methylomonas sp. SURF-2]MCQ8102642.1 hypothetical protein [Methylomonas sp. SURF-2]
MSRKPKDLLAHLRRIYFCYQNALPEPLFAALLDLLIVLDQKGRDLSLRLLWGSRSLLNEEQQACLKNLVQGRQDMRGSRFSVFTKGVVGVSSLLETKRQVQSQHDYLGLAADFIEYSQLEEAMDILEQGLEQTPDRQDFQALLLELYKSTESSERFQKQYDWMLESGEPLIDQWQQLAVFFNGKSS